MLKAAGRWEQHNRPSKEQGSVALGAAAVAEPGFCSWVFPLSKKSNKNTSSEYRQLKIQAHFLDLTSYSTMN